MDKNMSGGLGINTDVIEKIVVLAALEVEGVAHMANKSLDIKGIVNNGSAFKPARVTVKNGAASIDVYITARSGNNVKTVAESVQQNIKDKVQDMTGNAITRVNVHIADLATDDETAE